MNLKRKWIAYFNKEKINYTKGLVDPMEFHKTVYVLSRLFRIIDNEKLPWYMIITPVSVAASAILAGTIFFISMTHYIKTFNVALLTEAGTYFVIMVYKFLILTCTWFDLPQYHNFLRALRYDFKYICTKGSKYRERYFEIQIYTFKACVLTGIFTGSIGFGMMFCATLSVIYVSAHSSDPNDRPLPFPFWLFDYNLQQSPVYEIMFLLSVIFTFCHTYLYIFMMQTQILWVRQITIRADVINWRIHDLFSDVQPAKNEKEKEFYAQMIKHGMREIIWMHHEMFNLMVDYAKVYKKCLLFEQKLASPIICLTAYCAAEKFDSGGVSGILILLCVAVIIVVLIPSYLCTFLAEKVQSISHACWDTPFWNAGPVVRPYLVLMMQRSMRPLPIQSAGFDDISLQTYANIITGAYSYFNMLRQANFDIS